MNKQKTGMLLHINNKHPKVRISRNYFEKKIHRIIEHLHLYKSVIGVSFVTDQQIASLNHRFLKKNKPTDVLSFPMDSQELLGDVVVSVDTAVRQAKEYGVSRHERMMVLIIHGILHLIGYDHNTKEKWKKMMKKEKELWEVCGVRG